MTAGPYAPHGDALNLPDCEYFVRRCRDGYWEQLWFRPPTYGCWYGFPVVRPTYREGEIPNTSWQRYDDGHVEPSVCPPLGVHVSLLQLIAQHHEGIRNQRLFMYGEHLLQLPEVCWAAVYAIHRQCVPDDAMRTVLYYILPHIDVAAWLRCHEARCPAAETYTARHRRIEFGGA